MLVMHLTETPRPVRQLEPDVPAHVEAAIMRGLARARDDRFDGIPSFMEALRGGVAGSTMAMPEAAKALPRPVVATEVLVQRTAALPSATTFSRATGEVRATDDNELLIGSTQPRRWLPITIGGVVVAGLGLFLLFPGKPSHESTPRVTPVAAPVKVVEPVRQETPQPPLPVVLPIKPDAGPTPSALAASATTATLEHEAAIPLPTPRRPRHEAKNTLLPKPPENAKPMQSVSVPATKKSPGVAGF